jgi:hypothetical protein
VPASLLLVTPDMGLVDAVYGALDRAIGARVWIWHEPAAEPAVRVLSVCRFRLVLLDVTLVEAGPEWMLPSLKQAAPETPLALLGTELGRQGAARPLFYGAAATVPRGDLASLVRVVRQIIGGPEPPTDRRP